MKLTKKIKALNKYGNLELKFTLNTKDLTRDESIKEMNHIIDYIAEALMKNYNFNQIYHLVKIIKT